MQALLLSMTFMHKIVLSAFLMLLTYCGYSQSVPVTISLSDPAGGAVIAAQVRVMDAADTTSVQYAIADTVGAVVFKLMTGHSYQLLATSIGYKSLRKPFVVSATEKVLSFTLVEDNQLLDEVRIIGSRPLMRQEDDKVIVDPEPLISTSTSTLEVLEKTPGLFVDPDGNVYLSSTTPATIYINGREQRMSTADIASMLKSLPPDAIAQIEILRTPSAKYDASGSGGVVNIVLRKGVKIGLTGSVNTSLNQGRYGNQVLGVNLNNHDGKKHSYLNLNYSKRNSYEKVETERLLADNSQVVQKAFTTHPSDVAYAGFGFGYEFTPKWEVNYDSRLNYNLNHSYSVNESAVIRQDAAAPFSENSNYLTNGTNVFSMNQGITAKYKVNESGSEITTDFSFGYTENKGTQDYRTSFRLPKVTELEGNGHWTNRRYFWSGQVDARFKLPKEITLETGLKATFQDFQSSTDYFIKVGDEQERDTFRSTTFRYRDNINAAYLQGSRAFGCVCFESRCPARKHQHEGPADDPVRHRLCHQPHRFVSVPVPEPQSSHHCGL